MDKGFILEAPVTRWVCKLCTAQDVTREAGIHTRMHSCAGLGGLTAPMLDEKLNCKVEIEEREDYIDGEIVQLDGNGRPVMSLKTTRDDGEDLIVYAPTSRMRA